MNSETNWLEFRAKRIGCTGLRLWRKKKTEEYRWKNKRPSINWYNVPYMYEDELPELSKEQYDWWYANSIVDGVRIGPCIK